MRYQITFAKTGAMRFTGHLDVHTTLERTMRRANLPLVYSEGFTPRPKLSLASALPLGYTSEAEVGEFWLKEELPVDEVAKAFHAAAPPGIALKKLTTAPYEASKLQNALTAAEFVITFRERLPGLAEKVGEMMAVAELPRVRVRKGKKKTYDLRELIYEAQALPGEGDEPDRLRLLLRAEPNATGRPDELLEELGIDPLSPKIHRTRLLFEEIVNA
jgi:radical SAM-linked protein